MKNYGLFQGKAVEVSAQGRNLYEAVPFTTNKVSASNFNEYAKPLLGKYGLKIVRENESVVQFVSAFQPRVVPRSELPKATSELRYEGWDSAVVATNPTLQIYEYPPDPAKAEQKPSYTYSVQQELLGSETSLTRKPLPDKAPADSTWLSPFGPLTTKAAKAAKPHTTYDGPLLINSFGSAIGHSFQRLFEKISGGQNFTFDVEKAYSFSPTNRSAFELVLTSTMERQYTRRISEIRYSPELTNTFISWPPETRLIKAKDFAREMHPVLNSNGVTVVDEGDVVTAFSTKYAKIVPINPRPYSLLYTYSLIIALVCGTAGLPHILVRFYTNPDGVAAKRTTMWVMILIGVFYVFPPVFGVMGRNLLPELYSGIGAKGTDKIVLELPRILNEVKVSRWESGKVGEGTNAISPAHSPTSPLSAAPANKPSSIPWGSILSGITCAGAFAAFMSTFSGLLVSMTGAMAHDVYGRMLNPKATPEQRLRAFKIAAVIIGGVAILLGSQVEPLEINFMVGQAFAIAAASYFPLLFMAVWWRKLTMKGAATGMLTGGLSALIGISLTSFSTLAVAPGKTGELFAVFKSLNDFWAAHPLLRILCEQPAIWAVPLAIVLMVIVSKLTSRDVPEDIRMKMLVLHAPEKLGLKQEYIQEHQHGGH
jgi:Na+(H+)/acetate symporter ActP